MKSALLLIACFLAVAAFLKYLKNKGEAEKKEEFRAERKRPLTNREIEMYKVLKLAFEEPTFTVLAQVSMQALITSEFKFRNRYSQKYVDFVVCSPSFFALAVIELDDRTHRGKESKDAARDAMLNSAGIKVLRYRQIPKPENARSDVMTAESCPKT